MKTMEIITLLAILVGPVAAIFVSKYIDHKKQKRNGKEWIFKTLMRTRATSLSPSHVEALNMIDVEFYGDSKMDKEVVAAWKLYLDNLGDTRTSEEIKYSKREDLFLDLLYKMANSLNYDFDKQHIKNTSYIPQGYINVEREQTLVHQGVLGILNGDLKLPVYITNVPQQQEIETSSVTSQ